MVASANQLVAYLRSSRSLDDPYSHFRLRYCASHESNIYKPKCHTHALILNASRGLCQDNNSTSPLLTFAFTLFRFSKKKSCFKIKHLSLHPPVEPVLIGNHPQQDVT